MTNTQSESGTRVGLIRRLLRPNAVQRDITVPKLKVQGLKWGTKEEIQESLKELYGYAEGVAEEAIYWYGYSKRKKAWKSRLLRFLAIILTAVGGLTPIISSLGWSTQKAAGTQELNIGQLGYLFLGLAAACIGLDRYFGFSSGWMRYITTKMTLERTMSEFRFDWAMMVAKFGAKEPTPDQVQLMIQRGKEFLSVVNNYLNQETQEWVSEFRTNLAEIERTAKAQAETSQPGAIAITVTNGMETENGFTVTLDGQELRRVTGTKYQISYVPPGTHKVAVSGVIKNESLDASELVKVLPGAIVEATLSLPVKEAQP